MIELETIVNQLEKGELSLEESLKSFERGIKLSQQCQQALHNAEQKVQKLTQNEHGLQDFNHEVEDEL